MGIVRQVAGEVLACSFIAATGYGGNEAGEFFNKLGQQTTTELETDIGICVDALRTVTVEFVQDVPEDCKQFRNDLLTNPTYRPGPSGRNELFYQLASVEEFLASKADEIEPPANDPLLRLLMTGLALALSGVVVYGVVNHYRNFSDRSNY